MKIWLDGKAQLEVDASNERLRIKGKVLLDAEHELNAGMHEKISEDEIKAVFRRLSAEDAMSLARICEGNGFFGDWLERFRPELYKRIPQATEPIIPGAWEARQQAWADFCSTFVAANDRQ